MKGTGIVLTAVCASLGAAQSAGTSHRPAVWQRRGNFTPRHFFRVGKC